VAAHSGRVEPVGVGGGGGAEQVRVRRAQERAGLVVADLVDRPEVGTEQAPALQLLDLQPAVAPLGQGLLLRLPVPPVLLVHRVRTSKSGTQEMAHGDDKYPKRAPRTLALS